MTGVLLHDVDPVQPLDIWHPHANGLVEMYKPLPWSGGRTLYGLRNSYDGTLTGYTAGQEPWVAGRDGLGAISLDGTDDSVIVASISRLQSDASWMAWVNTNTASANKYVMDMGVNKGTISLNAGKFTSLPTGFTGGAYIYRAGSDLRDGVSHHVAATQQGTTLRGFVDGVEVGSASLVQVGDVNSMSIGKYGASNAYNFDGQIDDVRIYNRSLSSSEVWDQYEDALTGRYDLLRRVNRNAFWFVGGAATTASGDIFGRRGGVFNSSIFGTGL